MHNIPSALIGSEVIIIPAVSSLADACFFCTATPMAHIVAGSQPGKTSLVVAVNFACMPCHGLCHAKDVCTSGTQEAVPQPHICAKFGIVPGHAAKVVSPFVAGFIVRMHYISKVPETIPVVLFNGLHIIGYGTIQIVLDLTFKRSRKIRQAPNTKSFGSM